MEYITRFARNTVPQKYLHFNRCIHNVLIFRDAVLDGHVAAVRGSHGVTAQV